MNSFPKPYAFLLIFYLLSYILLLGAWDLIIPDETRYAEIPREMIAQGDWVVPRLDGLRYFEKPPLGYWVQAGSLLLFGENNFALRLPSALSVGASALLIYALAAFLVQNEKEKKDFSAILAALVFLSCFEVFLVGNLVTLDSLFSLFLTAAIIAFFAASEAPPRSAREKLFLLLSGVSCGLAFLTKGFLAFALPVLVLAPYLVWQRRYSDLFRMSWLPMVIAGLTALPWGMLIHLREPDFWRYFFWNEHIRRFLAENAQHKESFWFFFLLAPAMFFPWSFLAPAVLTGIKTRFMEQSPIGRMLRLCLCWLALPFLFFSFSSGKLITYIFPCFPPFAVLTAFGLIHAFKKEVRINLVQRGMAASTLLIGLILMFFLYVQFFGYNGYRPYSQTWKVTMVVNGFVFFILFCFWAFRSRDLKNKLLLFGAGPLLMFFVAHFTIPDLVMEMRAPGSLLERHRQDIVDDDIIISDKNVIRAVCWYLHRSDVYVWGAGELSYGLSYKDAGDKFVDLPSVVNLINQNRGKTVLIARIKAIREWRDQLPEPAFQDQNGSFGCVLWKF
ncbi:MAG: phospholipid carrier-dependent glycosyltransferase [Candidatus Omnitrophica bacterium]|nr:phospholipid carrier-dependent glycosyltransferase [Candidatus Omnitrophota bacterium]